MQYDVQGVVGRMSFIERNVIYSSQSCYGIVCRTTKTKFE